MKKRKLIFVFLGIVAYLFVGVKQAEFLNNSLVKDPVERTVIEKAVTLSLFMSEEDLQEASVIHEQRKEGGYYVSWENRPLKSKVFPSTLGWIITYFIILIGYIAFFLWWAKWIILGIILLTLYTNFGYWLGNYLHMNTGKKDFVVYFFEKLPWFLKIDWEQAEISGEEYLWKFLFTFFWSLYTAAAFVAWMVFIIYKIIAAVWWMISKILWLVTAGPVRDKVHRNTKTGGDIIR